MANQQKIENWTLPKDETVDTKTSPFLSQAFGIVGLLVSMREMHFDLDDRCWADRFECIVVEIGQLLRKDAGAE
jgi:hypothetical protein